MQNWRKNRNYRKYKNADGTFTYIITVDGEAVTVSQSLYKEYSAASRKMEYIEHDLKRDRVLKDASGKTVKDENGQPVVLPEREVSLDKLIGEYRDFPAPEPSPEDAFFASEDSDATELHRCITLLADDEQALINALFFKGMTERGYAEKLNISKTALHARKVKVLEKLRKLMGS